MITFPPCKINLGLHILRKRSDGFHDLDTCFVQIPWCDILEIVPASELQLKSSGLTIEGPPEDNLCLKAYHLVAALRNIPPVAMYLHKQLPSGAGLGGGSADAAYTLRALNDLFSLHLPATQLTELASRLGSDCAFFMQDEPMTGSGKGEILSPVQLPLKGKYLAIIKPKVSVNTREAYSGVQPLERSGRIHDIVSSVPIENWHDTLVNDFEASVFKRFPEIQTIKDNLYKLGAIYASMSGSGSAVFGIFDSEPDLTSFGDLIRWQGKLPDHASYFSR